MSLIYIIIDTNRMGTGGKLDDIINIVKSVVLTFFKI